MTKDLYEDAQNAAMAMTQAVLGYAHVIEGRDRLDAKDIAEVVLMLRNAAKMIDTLSSVTATKERRGG